jgi:hypothetical protein
MDSTVNEHSPIESLHPDLLTHIFAFCDRQDLVQRLPLVCHKFRSILASPTVVWHSMRVDLRSMSSEDPDRPFDGTHTSDAHAQQHSKQQKRHSSSGLSSGVELCAPSRWQRVTAVWCTGFWTPSFPMWGPCIASPLKMGHCAQGIGILGAHMLNTRAAAGTCTCSLACSSCRSLSLASALPTQPGSST